MYDYFFQLNCRPFDLAPDPKFLFMTGQHSRAAANVRFALMNHDSFVVITGEIGTGKTTVLNTALRALGSQYVTARLVHTTLSDVELLQSLLSEFGIANYSTKKVKLLDELRALLPRAAPGGAARRHHRRRGPAPEPGGARGTAPAVLHRLAGPADRVDRADGPTGARRRAGRREPGAAAAADAPAPAAAAHGRGRDGGVHPAPAQGGGWQCRRDLRARDVSGDPSADAGDPAADQYPVRHGADRLHGGVATTASTWRRSRTWSRNWAGAGRRRTGAGRRIPTSCRAGTPRTGDPGFSAWYICPASCCSPGRHPQRPVQRSVGAPATGS